MTVRVLLVANRGEIARRVFRSCRDLGISTIALHSDADTGAPYVQEADARVRLAGNTPAETYLRTDRVVAAALQAGADAVHPGYGFLSENADFARSVIGAGLTWVGPPVEAIETMGSKIESKRQMAAAGVPVLAELSPDAVTEADLPVLIKASAGGGGRGMRVVRSLDALRGEIELASAEAQSAFGDATVFCEPYLETGRHIEVQVMADMYGTVWAVGERECSIQRRHQKVVEEAPSPLVERVDGMRAKLFEAACTAARAIDYVGAGTVEFLSDDAGRFYFLEMNTRLQVEHPVTEATTGLDLVALQIDIAEGGRLAAEPPATRGHAIEVRLYAEDPAAQWQPQTGTLSRFEIPGVVAEFENSTYGIRLDSGVVDGSAVGVYYDPMLAKVIGFAPTRPAAARALARALHRARIHGMITNRDLLVRVLRHPAFLAGDTDTAFFDRHGLETLSAPLADPETHTLAALAAALADATLNREVLSVQPGVPTGWRNVTSQPHRKCYSAAGKSVEVCYLSGRDGFAAVDRDDVRVVAAAPAEVVLEVAGVAHAFSVARYGDLRCVDSALGAVMLHRESPFPDPSSVAAPGSLLAPMPGTVVQIAVGAGDQVDAGQPILWLEAMKMQHQINAPVAGVVAELPVRIGQQMELGAVLAVVESTENQ